MANAIETLQMYVRNLSVFMNAVKVFFLVHVSFVLYGQFVSPIKIFGPTYGSFLEFMLLSVHISPRFDLLEITIKLIALVILFTILSVFILVFKHDSDSETSSVYIISEALGRGFQIIAFAVLFLIISVILGMSLAETFSLAHNLTIIPLFLLIFVILPPIVLGKDLINTITNLKDTIPKNKLVVTTNFILVLILIFLLWNFSHTVEILAINLSGDAIKSLGNMIIWEGEGGPFTRAVQLIPGMVGEFLKLFVLMGVLMPLFSGLAALPYLTPARLESELKKLRQEDENIKSQVDVARVKHHKRKLDEESMREIVRDFERRSIEIETRAKQIEEELGKG